MLEQDFAQQFHITIILLFTSMFIGMFVYSFIEFKCFKLYCINFTLYKKRKLSSNISF